MRERRGRGRVGQVVGGHVDGLHRRDRSLVRRGDALWQWRPSRWPGRLVTDGAGDAAEEGRHFRTSLREAEDVVDEEQNVAAFVIAEVFGDGEAGQRDAGAGAGGSFIWPNTSATFVR